MTAPGPWSVLLQLAPDQWAVIVVLLLVGVGVKAFVLWWLYLDTTARGRAPLWWLVAAVPFDVPTLVVWLFVRPADPGSRVRRAPRAPSSPVRVHMPEHSSQPVAPDWARPAAPIEPEPEQALAEVRLTCPGCATRFVVEKGPEALRVECPECGRTGTIPAEATGGAD